MALPAEMDDWIEAQIRLRADLCEALLAQAMSLQDYDRLPFLYWLYDPEPAVASALLV